MLSRFATTSSLGEKILQGFMPLISTECKLSRRYTNHSIRATNTTILKRNNFTDAQVMSVSGHKSASSLAVYQRVSEPDKVAMGNVLMKALDSAKEERRALSNMVLDDMDLADCDTFIKGERIFSNCTFSNCKFVINMNVHK